MDLSTLGARSGGTWTRAQALELLTPGEVDGFVRSGTWQVVWRGVYADAGHVLDAEQRALAAVLAAGGAGQTGRHLRAAACGRTAERVHGLPLLDDDGRYDDVAVATRTAGARWSGRVLRPYELHLPPGTLRRRPSGLLLTRPAPTIGHLSTLLGRTALVCALDAALHAGLVDGEELAAVAAARAGCPGAPALREAVAHADGRAESPAETLARLLLLPELPQLRPQVRVVDRWGRVVARVDLGEEEARFAVEVDGVRGHAGAQMVAKDRRRDRTTEDLGWHTERLTWADLRATPRATVRRVRAAYDRHLARRRSE